MSQINRSGESKNAAFLKRFRFAGSGIAQALKNESSLRIQFFCALVLAVTCIFLRPSLIWCGLFIAMCALVISLELVNSAFEAYLDKFHPNYDETVGLVKDCLAGAVLVASMGSVFVFIAFLYSRFGAGL
jgi:diacylglycerol kinase